MISKVYVIACDTCKQNLQILKANSIGTAFKAAKKLPWKTNTNNTVHMCPGCMAKIDNTKTGQEVIAKQGQGKADK